MVQALVDRLKLLTCQPILSKTGETLGAPLRPGSFAPSAGQIRADTCDTCDNCDWTRAQLSDPYTSYRLSIEGLEPIIYHVMPKSCQNMVVQIA